MTLPDGRKVIAFDFDGVLHEYHGWNGGLLGEPIEGMRYLIDVLRAEGAYTVIHTTRDKATVQAWLVTHGFPVMNVYNTKWSRIDVFVDDRALHFHPNFVAEGHADMFARQLLDFQPYWRTTP